VCSTYVVPSEFARELERENAALLLEVEDLELQNNAMRSTSRGKEVAKNKKLERENATLREERDSYRLRAEQNWGLRKEIQSALNVPSDCEGEEALKQGLAVIKTLRADKERLDWIARNRSISATERPWSVTPESLRESIDAARKEAQP
jgi:hypothetical protein